MDAFLVGFALGLAFAACGFIIFLTRKPIDPVLDPWTEEYHQPPKAEKTTVNRRREIEL
jgi:hypothetical protein